MNKEKIQNKFNIKMYNAQGFPIWPSTECLSSCSPRLTYYGTTIPSSVYQEQKRQNLNITNSIRNKLNKIVGNCQCTNNGDIT